ncbi:MAG: DUF1488 family protein [Rhizobiales bacterium]|nr:DUF1488 family protein [Hyphomicrobiales bacterium]
MGTLAFLDDDALFDGSCVRFTGTDGGETVVCGVTTAALQSGDPGLPHLGLVPAEAFLETYRKLMIRIHDIARMKYQNREFEGDGPIRIMVHRRDLVP